MRALPVIAGLALLVLALLQPAAAGTATEPEITDPRGDGGTDQLDILSVWVDPSTPTALTFHVTFAGAPPAYPAVQGTQTGTEACQAGTGCVYASLSYYFTFRVLTPAGDYAPNFPDYAGTYVTFRDGPQAASLATPMGYVDSRGLLNSDGSVASATLNGSELVLSIPRSNAFVNLPNGLTPGPYVVDHLHLYSVPETCFPPQQVSTFGVVSCAPLAKPVAPTQNTPPTTTPHWDDAPDVGYGKAFAYPSPVTATPSPTPTVTTTVTQTQFETVTQTVTYTQAPTTVQHTVTVTTGPNGVVTTVTVPVPQAAGATTEASKKSPAPEAVVVGLLAIAGLLAVRRRLSA